MRFGFALHGSRGDVQPGVAAAAELAARGHSVMVAVPANLTEAVARTGLDTREVGPDTAQLLAGPLIQSRLKSRNPVVRVRALREVAAFGAAASEQMMGELADNSDVLITGLLAQERAATIAESRGIAFRPLHYCPIRPSRTVSPPPLDLPGAMRAPVWRLADHAYWWTVRGGDRALRRRLGLPPARGPVGIRLRAAGVAEIQAYDAALFPGLANEWGTQRPFAGFLLPDAATFVGLNGGSDASSATDAAVTWARAGRPPIYVGFGSMPVSMARLQSIVAALLTDGHRVIAHHHGGSAEAAGTEHPRVYWTCAPLDHAQLLPTCAGAVHHGGAGTTAAVARAGIPMVIGWLSADQPIWGRAVKDRGAGIGVRLSTLGPKHLTPFADDDAARAAHRLAKDLVSPESARSAVCDALETCS